MFINDSFAASYRLLPVAQLQYQMNSDIDNKDYDEDGRHPHSRQLQ